MLSLLRSVEVAGRRLKWFYFQDFYFKNIKIRKIAVVCYCNCNLATYGYVLYYKMAPKLKILVLNECLIAAVLRLT